MGNDGNQKQRQIIFLYERNIIVPNETLYRSQVNFRKRKQNQAQNIFLTKTTIGNRRYDDDIISVDKSFIDSNFQVQRQMIRNPSIISDEQTVRNNSILVQKIQQEKKNLNKLWIKAYIEKENQLNELKREYKELNEDMIKIKRQNFRMKRQENSQVRLLKQTIKEQQIRIKNYQDQVTNHFTTISQLSSKLSNKNNQLTLKNNSLSNLKQLITNLQIKLQQSQQRNIQNILSISQLEKIINEIKQNNKIIQQANMKLKQQLAQKANTIQNSLKNTNKLLTQKYQLQCEIKKIRKQMNIMYSNDHHQLSKQCIKQQYGNIITSIQNQNQQLKRRIDRLNKQKEKLLMDIIEIKKGVLRNISVIVSNKENNNNNGNQNNDNQSILNNSIQNLNSTENLFKQLIKQWQQIEQQKNRQQHQHEHEHEIVIANNNNNHHQIIQRQYYQQQIVEDIQFVNNQ